MRDLAVQGLRITGALNGPRAASARRVIGRTGAVVLLLIAVSACRTAPPPMERDLVAYLPVDQGAWLFINDAATGEVVLDALLPPGIAADQLSQVVDRTDLVVASIGRLPGGRLNLVAFGRYPRRIIERNLRRDPAWEEVSLGRDRPANSYFVDAGGTYQIAVLRSGLVVLSQGEIHARLDQAFDIEAGRRQPPDEAVSARLLALESQAQRHGLSIYFPAPGRDALSRLGGAPIRMPIDDITLFFDRVAAAPGDGSPSGGSVELSGVISMETERDARAFHVLFRLLFLATVRDAGLDMQRLSALLESSRDEHRVLFAGIRLQPEELRRLMESVTVRFAS